MFQAHHVFEPSSENRWSRNYWRLGEYIEEYESAQLHGKKVRHTHGLADVWEEFS